MSKARAGIGGTIRKEPTPKATSIGHGQHSRPLRGQGRR